MAGITSSEVDFADQLVMVAYQYFIRPTGAGVSPSISLSSVPSQQTSGVAEPPPTPSRLSESITFPSSGSRGTTYVLDRPYAHHRC